MNYYGNIIIVYDSPQALDTLVQVINKYPKKIFQVYQNTIFLGTTTIKDLRSIEAEMSQTNVNYLFFHLAIPAGSGIRAHGVPPVIMQRIANILFED